MTPQHTPSPTVVGKPTYDNTALRERIGTSEIATRSFDELHAAARSAAGTEDEATRGRWSWRKGRR